MKSVAVSSRPLDLLPADTLHPAACLYTAVSLAERTPDLIARCESVWSRFSRLMGKDFTAWNFSVGYVPLFRSCLPISNLYVGYRVQVIALSYQSPDPTAAVASDGWFEVSIGPAPPPAVVEPEAPQPRAKPRTRAHPGGLRKKQRSESRETAEPTLS